MLSYEWRELETLCQRLAELRERQKEARKSRNSGLTTSLDEDIAKAQRQRELLVHHISSRLGTVAAGHHEEPDSPVHRARRKRAAAHTERPSASAEDGPETAVDLDEK